MANLKCALCGNYINKKKRYVSRCFQGRGLPRASSIKRHLPPVLAVLVAGGKPSCPKEPCVHDGPLGSTQSCYSVLLAAWKTQGKPAAISSPPTDDLRWTAALPSGLELSEHPSYTIVCAALALTCCSTCQLEACTLRALILLTAQLGDRRIRRRTTGRGMYNGRRRRCCSCGRQSSAAWRPVGTWPFFQPTLSPRQ